MKRTIGSLIGLVLVAAGCGQEGSTPQAGGTASDAASPATMSTAPADPLEGEWRAEFTCQDVVRAVERRLSAKEIHEQVGSLKSFLEGWGAETTKADPCHGATRTSEILVLFGDGYIALYENGQGGVNAPYELVDDHTIIVNDASGNLCPCPGTWEFEITGDEVTFHVTPDAHLIHAWESAPFERVS